MLKLYDYLDDVLREHDDRKWFYETRLNFFANDVMEKLEITDRIEMEAALNRTFNALRSLQISPEMHFKRVYCFNDQGLDMDFKISSFACYLLIVNSNPRNDR